MLKLSLYSNKDKLSATIIACLLIMSVLPGFKLIGNLLAQVALTVFLIFITLLITDFLFKIRPEIISISLNLMTVFWILIALVKQIALHISNNDYTFKWLPLFYYDKPALIFVVMFISILYYVIRLLNKKNNQDYKNSYKIFIKNTLRCLLVYYVIILFYCFYLVRNITFEHSEPNLIPFKVITFSLNSIDYELLFLLLGNIAIFFPLGVLVSSLTSNKYINILLPIVLSISIEVSQYILGNGHPDIDDVILNVIGYYLGIIIRIILDRIVYIASDKEFKSFILL